MMVSSSRMATTLSSSLLLNEFSASMVVTSSSLVNEPSLNELVASMFVSVTSVLLLSTALNESSMIVTSSSEVKVWKKNELVSLEAGARAAVAVRRPGRCPRPRSAASCG